ncbi:hypothetical protein BB561_000525 [Smittium simulii]|uniref:Uncharacterized protein n=1 Tax=Smittium simulii TaxID=133385 RepID=A0A2T9YYS4_9FUNG|nr:hypothetical protein BB561_000525 [Smittium simulii]
MNYNPLPLNKSALSAATRPIYYYDHRKIQDNPTLDTAEDPETMFAITMRSLFLEFAVTVTQARVDNLHKKMVLPENPRYSRSKQETASQKAESPAFLQEPARKGIQDLIHELNLKHGPTADVTFTAGQKKADKGSQQSLDRGGGIPLVKENIEKVHHKSLDFTASSSKFPRRLAATAPEPKLQDENNIHNMLHTPPKELPCVFRFLARIFAHPGLQEVQKIHLPPDLYQCTFPSYRIDQIKRNTSLSVSKRPNDSKKKKEFCTTNTHLVYSSSSKEPFSIEIKIMDVDSNYFGPSNPKPTLLKESTEITGQTLELVILLSADVHQYQGTIDCVIRSLLQENSGPLSEVHIFQTTGIIRAHLETFSEDKHQTSGNLRTFSTEPSRRPEQIDCSNRMNKKVEHIPVGSKTLNLQNRMHWHTTNQKLNQPGNLKTTQREDNYDTVYSNVEIGNMVSGSSVSLSVSTAITSCNNSYFKPQNRKFFAIKQQTLEIKGLEGRRRFLKTQGLMVSGFLRAINIYRIDGAWSQINQGLLYLKIVAPKEKRGSRPVEKPRQINSHTNPILCPVKAYIVYEKR